MDETRTVWWSEEGGAHVARTWVGPHTVQAHGDTPEQALQEISAAVELAQMVRAEVPYGS